MRTCCTARSRTSFEMQSPTGPGNSVEEGLTGAVALAFIRLLVRDYGQRVPESELVDIFQPFYRVPDDRNRQSGGTVSVFAIADRIVRIHRGTVRHRTPFARPGYRNPPAPGTSRSIHRNREVVLCGQRARLCIDGAKSDGVRVRRGTGRCIAARSRCASIAGATAATHHPSQHRSHRNGAQDDTQHRKRTPASRDSEDEDTSQHRSAANRSPHTAIASCSGGGRPCSSRRHRQS